MRFDEITASTKVPVCARALPACTYANGIDIC